jgi:hypothetical protein
MQLTAVSVRSLALLFLVPSVAHAQGGIRSPRLLRAEPNPPSAPAGRFLSWKTSPRKQVSPLNTPPTPRKNILSSMSGGVIILDYDRDGWPDIYFTNAPTVEMALKGQKSRGALYHNNHDGTFSDLTDKSGLSAPCFAMGGAVGDYDNDGWPDLYGTRLGGNVLFHNNAMAPLLTSPPKRTLPMAAGPPERPSVITTAMVTQTDEIQRWKLSLAKRFARALWLGRGKKNHQR